MARSPAGPSVTSYLEALPDGQRQLVGALRDAIRAALPDGYIECMQYGMIGYVVPHDLYAPGYHCDPSQPLPFLGLGAGKNACSLHLFGLYLDETARADFEAAWRASGKRLDMGKSCVRIRTLAECPLEIVSEAVAAMPVARLVALYERSRTDAAPRAAATRKAAKKPAEKAASKASAKGISKADTARAKPARAAKARPDRSR